MTDQTGSLVGEELCTCPFCGGNVAVAHEPPAVMHSVPYCDRFRRDEPHVFLRNLRKEIERRARS